MVIDFDVIQDQSSMARNSLAYRAYRQLEEMIVTLDLEPGTILPENVLCEMIDIGRTPVREALKRLADDGLVTIIARRGVQITNIDVRRELYLTEIRKPLEELVCGRAARRRNEEELADFRELAQVFQRAEEQNDFEDFLRADKEFNSLIIRAARNPYVKRAIAPLHSASRRFWCVNSRRSSELGGSAKLHLPIVRAIIAGDEVAAVSASTAHMDQVIEETKMAAMNLDF